MRFEAADIAWTGEGLDRPECVLCTASGDSYVSRRTGLSRVGADGRTEHREFGPASDWMVNGIAIDADGSFLVANLGGLGFTNESHVDPSGRWLYVNETYARRMTRFALAEDGTLGRREVVAEFRDGAFPDGMAFDAEGNVWLACVVANRLLRVTPSGRQEVLLDGSDPATSRAADAAWEAGRFDRPTLDRGESLALGNLASVAFGGPDLCTLHMGSLAGTRLATLRVPVAGARPRHWLARPGF